MYHPPDRSVTRRDSVLLILCLSLSVGALVLPTPYSQAFANAVRATALRPLIWLQQQAQEGRTSRRRFEAVEIARDSFALRVQQLPDLVAENERLRGLLGLAARLRVRFVAAEVLHQPVPTDGRTLLLSAGSQAGVQPYDLVLAPQGLVGIVAEVGPRTSLANTWAHPEFRASGVTADGSVLGMVAPSTASTGTDALLEFRGVAYSDSVPIGVAVMTAGLGDVYPRGLALGDVVGIAREEPGWERIYAVRPYVNPGIVSHVLIVHVPGARGEGPGPR